MVSARGTIPILMHGSHQNFQITRVWVIILLKGWDYLNLLKFFFNPWFNENLYYKDNFRQNYQKGQVS